MSATVTHLDNRRKPALVPQAAPIAAGDRIVRMPELLHRIGLSRCTIYRLIKAEVFPAQVALGGKSVGWRESAVSAWIASRGGAA